MPKPPKTALVVTTINPPNDALRELAAGCVAKGWQFHVAGDTKTPDSFALEGCDYLSLKVQRESGFALGTLCPERSYTRKNLGYLHAMRAGAEIIVETDDDNHPKPDFWNPRNLIINCLPVDQGTWVNVYRFFCSNFVYPRGLPVERARDELPSPTQSASQACPIQQGLADEDPDVDAIYRMLFPLPLRFDLPHPPVWLTNGAWCPFNSQNTTFFASAFPLLYLPSCCSFRMTDIWRSFVAQRVLHARGDGVLFHGPTVWQERNDHDLLKDFMDEIPGYANNNRIREELLRLGLDPKMTTRRMIELSYEVMMRHGWVGGGEEALLDAWFRDLSELGIPC